MSGLTARLLVFFTSASVLVLEILAGRLLAPYVGVTLETFTGIIGTVLAGISLGAWLGGRAADRHPPRGLLGPLLITGGVLTLLAPTIVAGTGPALRGGDPVRIVLLATLGFLAPAVALSAVTPVVVKIRLTSLDETGTVVGQLSAVGTAGAIFGTFVTGFVLLAELASRPIVLVVGSGLVATGAWFALRPRSLPPWRATALLAAAVAAAGLTLVVRGPCQLETAYYCVTVIADESRPSGRALWLDTLRHSYVDLSDPTHLEFRYAKLIADTVAVYSDSGPLDALYIGGGGFTLPRWLGAVRPGSTNTVLELDPALVTVAHQDLGLEPSDIDRIAVGDARLTLDATPERHFSLVVGDAFGGLSVPWHLTTREFLETVEEHMNDGGVYVMNLIDHSPAGFAKAEAATLAAVFTDVLAIAPPDYFGGFAGGNYVLVASNQILDPRRMEDVLDRRGAVEVVRGGDELREWIGETAPLTDDYAPVDQLLTRG